jgi:DNA invertase Pin-like site-specific DNA recombinase
MSRKKPIQIQTFNETRPYVLWRRVSTQEQGDSGLGLAAQLAIAKTFMGKDPVEIFTDVFSGTKLRQCKGLWAAIDYCKANGAVLVIAKSDRCRNVQEALEILDAIGSSQLIFCDLPTSDRFVLTVMWAMWERQAIMGRLNTKVALEERKKQIKEAGGFISKSGRFCDHLGRRKGENTPNAISAMTAARMTASEDWKRRSPLYLLATRMILRGEPRRKILQVTSELYDEDPVAYGTRRGKRLTEGVLSVWATETIVSN